NVFTTKQIETIQLNIIALLCYIKRHDEGALPRCFKFCEIIVKNIDICRNNGYSDIDELSEYIRQDWNSAMEIHTGLPEYYIPNCNFEIQKAINEAIKRQIMFIEEYLNI
ncbi:hypothetical protein, partial [Clostridium perfringens]